LEALPTSLHLWDPTPTQTAILETRVMEFYPTSSIESSDTMSFVIPPMEKYMLDKVDIVTELRVLRNDGSNIHANANISTAPHLAAALWRNVNVSIGNVALTQSFDNSYSMFKFWDTVLHNRSGSRPILFQKEGLLLDSVKTKALSEDLTYYPAAVEGGVFPDVVNANGRIRADRIRLSNKVSLISPFDVSIFNQDKLLPPNLEVRVGLTKNPHEFILMCPNAHPAIKIKLDKVALRCTFQKPAEMVLSLIEERLAKENAIFHADRKIMSLHPITAGTQEMTIDNLFNGPLPYYFIIGVQDRAALGRAKIRNPFSLYPMKSVQLFTNGREHFPIPVEWSEHNESIMYNTFLEQSGFMSRGDTLLGENYGAYPAMAFDLTPDGTQNQHNLNLVKSGTSRLTIGFDVEVPANRILMVLAWYEQIMEVSGDRQVILI